VRLVNEATPELPADAAEIETWFSNTVQDVVFALAEDAGGEPVAYADLAAAPADAEKAWLDVRIPPQRLDDSTVAPLLAWAEASARQRGRSVLRAFAASDSSLGPLLLAHGYRPIRHSFRMRIDLDSAPPEPVWPEGIRVATFEPGDERAVHAADAEAFEDHWDFTGFPYEEFEHFMLRAHDFDPTLWLVARDGDEVAGVSLCRPSLPGRPGVGWVRSLAVRRPWRRRGLGLALLLASFGAFWRRGTRVVGLGVDGENTTGAVRLYEKAGMHVEHRLDQYERRLG
jgi:ribosomal protein S18 acetylase RimI-like enzyme